MDLAHHEKPKKQIQDILRITATKAAVVLRNTQNSSVIIYSLSEKNSLTCTAGKTQALDSLYERASSLSSLSLSASGFFSTSTSGSDQKLSWHPLQATDISPLGQWQKSDTSSASSAVTAAVMLEEGRLAAAYGK